MITLNVDSIREFSRKTQYITPNTVFPVLANIKLNFANGKHYVTKSNNKCTCVGLINGNGIQHPDLLIDYDKLSSFVSITSASAISLEWDDEKIYISDGEKKIYFQREDPTNFPKTPSFASAKESFKFTREHLSAITIAKNYLLDTESGGSFRFVHLGANHISAFHTNFFYVNNRFNNLPEVLLNSEMCNVITDAADEFTFSKLDNQYFFLAVNVIYIFTMEEGKSPNVKSVNDRLSAQGKEFKFNKEKLVQFCTLANSIHKSPLCSCTMIPDVDKFKLSVVDSSYNSGCDMPVVMTGTFDKFSFDSRLFLQPIKTIPFESLECKTNQNCLIITSPDKKEYFCFMGLQNQN